MSGAIGCEAMWWLLAQIVLVQLHGPAGQEIFVNPKEVTSVRQPQAIAERHFAPGVRCILFMVNGNFIGVTDLCDDVRKLLTYRGVTP